jgi:hypothetical protein
MTIMYKQIEYSQNNFIEIYLLNAYIHKNCEKFANSVTHLFISIFHTYDLAIFNIKIFSYKNQMKNFNEI